MGLYYNVCRSIADAVLTTCFRIEVHEAGYVPRKGAVLIATNHASFLDPPAAGIRVGRELDYFARRTLFLNPVSRAIIQPLNVIPVDRDGPSDVKALKTLFRRLRDGSGVVVFPEGTRTRDGRLQPARPGVGMLACKSQAPVVPARIFGSFEAWGPETPPRVGSPIDVRYGPVMMPSEYDPGGNGRDRYQEASERIMAAIAAIETPHAAGA